MSDAASDAAVPAPRAGQATPGDVVEIRVKGDLDGYALSLFDGFDHVVEPVTTTVRGVVADEEQLADLCRRVRDAGLELVSLRRLPSEAGSSQP